MQLLEYYHTERVALLQTLQLLLLEGEEAAVLLCGVLR
jgi:hypothetical protein